MNPSIRPSHKQTQKAHPQLIHSLNLLQLPISDLESALNDLIIDNPVLEPIQDRGYSTNRVNITETMIAAKKDLKAHLCEQLRLSHLNEKDRLIGLAIIENLSDDGFFKENPKTITALFKDSEYSVTLAQINIMRHMIQNLDPIGSASIDIQDYLLIQLKKKIQSSNQPKNNPLIKDCIEIIENQFDLLKKRKLALPKEKLTKIFKLLKSLNSKPSDAYNTQTKPDYIMPDLKVRKKNKQWTVELNETYLPKLRFNQDYTELRYQHQCEKKTQIYLQSKFKEAKWLINALKQRSQTLMQVGTCIMEKQQAFLKYGEESMQALTLTDIATQLNIHPSTVSRSIAEKYIATPRGVFSLSHFFSKNIANISATGIQTKIRQIISAENIANPLSDQKIMLMLKKSGFPIARRTVAKYREKMGIESTTIRKLNC